MNFDWTVNVGQLVTAGATLGGGLIVFGAMRESFANLLRRVALVEAALVKQTDILIAVSRQEVRLDGHEARLENLEMRR